MKETVTNLWNWIDERGIVRRAVLFVTLWMTWEAFKWAAIYAGVSKFDGTGTALVIAAVLAPISFLQKSVFDGYLNSRGGQ